MPRQIAAIVVVSLTAAYAVVTNLIGPSHQHGQMLANESGIGGRALVSIATSVFPLIAIGGFLAGVSLCLAAVLIASAIARQRWAFATLISFSGLLMVFSVEGAGSVVPLTQPLSATSFVAVYPLPVLICLNLALWVWVIVAARRARRSEVNSRNGS